MIVIQPSGTNPSATPPDTARQDSGSEVAASSMSGVRSTPTMNAGCSSTRLVSARASGATTPHSVVGLEATGPMMLAGSIAPRCGRSFQLANPKTAIRKTSSIYCRLHRARRRAHRFGVGGLADEQQVGVFHRRLGQCGPGRGVADEAVLPRSGAPRHPRGRVGLVGHPHPAPRRVDQIVRGPLAQYLAAVHHHDVLAEGGDVLGHVRREQHGVALGDHGHRLAEPEALLGVEAGGGFVEHQKIGVAEQRLGHDDPSLHAARKCLDAFVRHVREAHLREHPPHLVVAGPPVGHLLEHREVVHEIERGEVRVVAGFLGEVAEATTDRQTALALGGIFAEHPHLARVGGEHGGDDAQQRGLAGAVWSEEAGDARSELQRDAL